jgi:hypothetical protein
MRKIYLKIFIGLVVLLWIIYFISSLPKYEGFTPKIRCMYRPYIRYYNQGYESFVNNYGPNVILNKLRKWNIY